MAKQNSPKPGRGSADSPQVRPPHICTFDCDGEEVAARIWPEYRAKLKNPERRPRQFTDAERVCSWTNRWDEAPVQSREELVTKTYQYWSPFKYANIRIDLGREKQCIAAIEKKVGGRQNVANPYIGEFGWDGMELDIPPFGAITIEEEQPIVAVTVIGSACNSPGFVILIGEPTVWQYPRTGVKMMVENLWGQHVLGGLFHGEPALDEEMCGLHTGLSSASFNTPECRKVTLMGGCVHTPGNTHYTDGDTHYCFRVVRITVRADA